MATLRRGFRVALVEVIFQQRHDALVREIAAADVHFHLTP
jgi:hypothetical protein